MTEFESEFLIQALLLISINSWAKMYFSLPLLVTLMGPYLTFSLNASDPENGIPSMEFSTSSASVAVQLPLTTDGAGPSLIPRIQ